MILRSIKKFIQIYIFQKKIKLPNKPRIFIFLAADYGNIGDIAITYSQEQFIKKYFSNYSVIIIPLKQTYNYFKFLSKNICCEDIITTIGGGNMGDLYYGFEIKRQFIIKHFKKNKIISFPQSISFSNTKFGIKISEKSKKIYNSHNNLVLFARDSESFIKMKELFANNQVYLVPDIVLSYKCNIERIRDNITFCLRNDKESNIDENMRGNLLKTLSEKFGNILQIDTHIGNLKSNYEYEKILSNKLEEFAKSKVVITDRLHGMIFCVLTKTPCIVISNNNHKIKKTYMDWLQDVKWIKYYDTINISLVIKDISYFLNNNFNEINLDFTDKFIPLIKESDNNEKYN